MFIDEAKTPEQLEALALTVYINELGQRLAQIEETGGVSEEPDDLIPRSPSPPPEYDREGRRTNTKLMRTVKRLEIERTLAVSRALELIPSYAPPADFRKLTQNTQKYYLPVRDHPQINFMGLLLGPRGKNLRRMELEAGAKISIRGRGSVKGGKRTGPVEEEQHCEVTSTSQQSITRAFELIEEVVNNAVNTPEHMNQFKREQLRELAELNGTLRDYENQQCGFCRQLGHKYVDCPKKRATKAEAKCLGCGETGHYVAECTNKTELVEDAVNGFMNEIDVPGVDENMGEGKVKPPGPPETSGTSQSSTGLPRPPGPLEFSVKVSSPSGPPGPPGFLATSLKPPGPPEVFQSGAPKPPGAPPSFKPRTSETPFPTPAPPAWRPS